MRIKAIRIMTMMTHIDMFSGAGLFSAGFAASGFRPVLAVDVSKEAVASFNRNLGPVALVGSVVSMRDIPKAEVLIAGPPCQGFSTLGRQDPKDKRNDLALEIPRWAAACGALVVAVENVPPFLKSPQWRELATKLEDLGYAITTWVLDAADYGAAQIRRRAFTIASKIGDVERPQPLAFRVNAGDILEKEIEADDQLHIWPNPTGVAKQRIALIPAKGDKRDIMRLAPELCPPSWARVGCQATDVWGRIDPDAPVNTLRCTFQNPSKGRYLHPTENRVISLREGARLQGIPDDWVLVGRPYTVARQIGNGVPVPLAAAVATSIASALHKANGSQIAQTTAA